MPEYEYPRPALTADVVLLREQAGTREVLLIQRRFDPFAGQWALPGGFVDEWELAEGAARRELAEETGVVWDGPLSLVGIFGKRGRDPRGWTVSAVYLAVLGEKEVSPSAGDDAGEVGWFDVAELPSLAFDHDEVLQAAFLLVEKRSRT
ncbi:MAG: NUDIX hydrolase [Coriobacteriia bacterium]|nr:NUDIX hydrolase [Coriobacteriia bacterium]MBN2822526.1 NUDIX hydrolase [Coriobacteriia bacterium]